MNKVQKRFVLEALDNEYKLSEWESQFVNDLAEKPDDYELSEKQNAVLNRIQNKVG